MAPKSTKGKAKDAGVTEPPENALAAQRTQLACFPLTVDMFELREALNPLWGGQDGGEKTGHPATRVVYSKSRLFQLNVNRGVEVERTGASSTRTPVEGEMFEDEVLAAARLEVVDEPRAGGDGSQEERILQAMGANFRRLQALHRTRLDKAKSRMATVDQAEAELKVRIAEAQAWFGQASEELKTAQAHWPRLSLRPRPHRGEASAYARAAAAATGAWVFDVDETLLSNLPYYAQHGYGLELFDHQEFDRWVETGEAPVIPSSLRLYSEVRDLGFKTFLLTGRSEAHEGRKSCRGPTILLVSAGFSRHLADLISGFLLYLNLDYNMLVANWNNPAVWFRRVVNSSLHFMDQFDTIDLLDNEIVKLENFPFMYRRGSPHLITTYNEREQVTPRELSIRVPAILRSKDEEGVKGCCVAGAVNNYTSQLLTYGSSSQSPSCKSSRQYNLTEALLFLSHFMGDIDKMLAFIHVLS
ncbi:uncharacterized protein [Triticum aestivum]|uniref:uncharacterized protein n=1 Tax=Triticum aestivum TaxID=4565 RepID=UPI001D00CEB5|nr:uncharacterized protein LOC123171256 [Triticum aestivum]